jgi:phosphatidylserine/phosphatidylglycerophosphate/cardiolipin synthase-like enzyme
MILWLLFFTVAFCACTTLPEPETKNISYAYEPLPDRKLAVSTRDLLKDRDYRISGFFMLVRNVDAMRWRLLLADLAEDTLDMQYFIWKDDISGDLLLDRIIKTADRGVRVRLLVDDIYIIGADRTVAALSQHPHIEVRLFNPMKQRTSSMLLFVLEFLGNIEQLNHRMHNKLIVADNRFSIVGGRNIGNEYFGKQVIESGIELFEMRRDAAIGVYHDTPPVEARKFGLHAKVMIIDRRLVFAGSLNLDPRSKYINTEKGLVIESPELGEAMTREFKKMLRPENSWQVLLDDKNRLVWKSGDTVRQREPPSSFGKRFKSWFFGLFDLDDQL